MTLQPRDAFSEVVDERRRWSPEWYTWLQELTALTTDIEADILALQTDVSTLQTDVSTLQTDLTALETLVDTKADKNALWAFLGGLDMSNAADTVNDITIAVGSATDSTGVRQIRLATAITKQLDVAWTVGTNQGGRDTGSIADGTWHVHLIQRSDTGVVDVLFSLSASAPTMPANYNFRRRIGSILREAGSIVQFVQDGDWFQRASAVVDADRNDDFDDTAQTAVLSVPAGIRVQAKVHLTLIPGANSTNLYVSDLSITDMAAASTSAPGSHIRATDTTRRTAGGVYVWTDTSRQIRWRVDEFDVDTSVLIFTHGWMDPRRSL